MAPSSVVAALVLICSCFQVLHQVGALLEAGWQEGELLGTPESSVVVVGSVFCDSCLEGRFTQNSVYLPGATVEIECRSDDGHTNTRAEGMTDMHGSFKIEFTGALAMSALRCIANLKKGPKNTKCSILSRPAYRISTIPLMLLTAAPSHQRVYSIGSLSFRPREAHSHCGPPALKWNVEIDGALNLRSRKALVREGSHFEGEMIHLQNSLDEKEHPIEEIPISAMRRSLLQSIPFLGPVGSIFGTSPPPPGPFSFPFVPPPPLSPGNTIPGFPTTPTVPTIPSVPTIPIPSTPSFSNPTTPFCSTPPPPIY